MECRMGVILGQLSPVLWGIGAASQWLFLPVPERNPGQCRPESNRFYELYGAE